MTQEWGMGIGEWGLGNREWGMGIPNRKSEIAKHDAITKLIYSDLICFKLIKSDIIS